MSSKESVKVYKEQRLYLTAESALRSEFVQNIEGAGVDLSKRRGIRLRAF